MLTLKTQNLSHEVISKALLDYAFGKVSEDCNAPDSMYAAAIDDVHLFVQKAKNLQSKKDW